MLRYWCIRAGRYGVCISAVSSRNRGQLTKGGQRIIICTQAQKEKEGNKPDANGKEGRYVHKRRPVIVCSSSISVLWLSESLCFVGFGGEVVEPGKVVCDDE